MMMTSKDILEQALRSMADNEAFTMRDTFVTGADDDCEEEEYEECDTPGCIAGHIIMAAPLKMQVRWDGETDMDLAARLADLTDTDRVALFTPVVASNCYYHFAADEIEPGHITREHAMACLRKFIDTGEIDWAGTAPEGDSDEGR